MSAIAPVTGADPTVDEMQARVARFASLRPTGDYVDAGIPGCERTTYRVLGHPPEAPLAAEEFHLNIGLLRPGQVRAAAQAPHAGGLHSAERCLGSFLGARRRTQHSAGAVGHDQHSSPECHGAFAM